MSPELSAWVFFAAIVAVTSALLGGVYLLVRHAPVPEEKEPKKIVVSNMK